jgi:adenine/guanine phosphoribosyltransferase-like PRPP-binding protein
MWTGVGAWAVARGESDVAGTTNFWQALHTLWPEGVPTGAPYTESYPVRLPDGRILVLPLRPLPDGAHAVASLIANHAAFPVVAALSAAMADLAHADRPELIVGLPTLGLAFAPRIAEHLGHTRYVPLGYSRKFWYEDALSEPVASITSPGGSKVIYLDPNLRPLLAGARVTIVDDAISSGASVLSVLRLLSRLDVEIASIVVAMKQTTRWQQALAEIGPSLPARVKAVYGCPLFARCDGGWAPIPETLPSVP